MEFRDYPLLNTPSLTAIILRAAQDGPATTEDFAERLEALLAAADEHPPVTGSEIRARLDDLAGALLQARLLATDGSGFGITERGRIALEQHPHGFSRPDMMEYPEFAAAVRSRSREIEGDDDPRVSAYDAGYAARSGGRALDENPFRPDSVDHLAWENGWSEAEEQAEGTDPA